MDKNTFHIIIKDFIKCVEWKRKNLIEADLSEDKTRAVLIVDGHKSRYDPRTFRALREANIDLVILPAHSTP